MTAPPTITTSMLFFDHVDVLPLMPACGANPSSSALLTRS